MSQEAMPIGLKTPRGMVAREADSIQCHAS